MRRVLLFLVLGGLLAAVESALLAAAGGRSFGLGLLTGLIVYLGIRAGNVDGAMAAAGIGYLWDVFAGTPTGLSVSVLVAVFLFVRFATQALDAVAPVILVVAAIAGVIRVLLVVLLLGLSHGLHLASTGTVLLDAGVEVVLGTLVAPLIYRLARALDMRLMGSESEGGEVWLS